MKHIIALALAVLMFSGVAAQAATVTILGNSEGSESAEQNLDDFAFLEDLDTYVTEGGDFELYLEFSDAASYLFDLSVIFEGSLGAVSLYSGEGTGGSLIGTIQETGTVILALPTSGTYTLFAEGPFENLADIDLAIQAVPIPAAAWLFLTVLAGAGFMRRKSVTKA